MKASKHPAESMGEKWIGDIRGVSGWMAVIFAVVAAAVLFVPLPFMPSSLIVRMIIGSLLGVVAFVLALVRLKKQRLLALVTIVAMLGVVIKVAPAYYALYELYMQGEAAMREHRRHGRTLASRVVDIRQVKWRILRYSRCAMWRSRRLYYLIMTVAKRRGRGMRSYVSDLR